MTIAEISPWVGLVVLVVGAIVGVLKFRSEIIFVKPSVITELQTRADKADLRANELSMRLDVETEKRRATDREMDSVKHDYRVSQHRMEDLETAHNELKEETQKKDKAHSKERKEWEAERKRLLEGIQTLISQIVNRHDSRPDWTPE